jgi:hypothetical protein
MKVFLRNSDRRAELSALAMIVTVLTIGALAKLDAATPLFHVARWLRACAIHACENNTHCSSSIFSDLGSSFKLRSRQSL